MNTVHGSRFTSASHSEAGRAVHSSKTGFTIIELMIAITISVLAMTAVYATFIVQQRSFVVQDQVSETQVSSKIAFDILTNRIMSAGFGYPLTETPSINGISDIIGSGDAGAGSSPDSITVVGGFRGLGTVGLPVGQGTTQIEQKDAVDYYLDICYNSATVFNTGTMSYLSIDGIFYAEVYLIDDNADLADCDFDGTLDPNSATRLYLDRPLTIEFPVDRPIYLIENVVFNIVVSDGNNCTAPVGTNCLQIVTPSSTTTLASNIDDIQFAYAIDADDDGEVDDQAGGIGGVFDPGDYINSLPVGAKVMAVRANLLASVANPDTYLDPGTKPYAAGITLENGNTIGAGDSIRRRIWSTELLLRNPR